MRDELSQSMAMKKNTGTAIPPWPPGLLSAAGQDTDATQEEPEAAQARHKAEQYAEYMLHHLGILPGFFGHKYFWYAITLCVLDPTKLELLTKTLYPAIAHRYATTVPCVERSMRYVLTHSLAVRPDTMAHWNEFFEPFLIYKKDKKPTIGIFITMVAALYHTESNG